jgi:YD repeat-containing protein
MKVMQPAPTPVRRDGRFRREVRAITALKHPGVVAVLDAGEHAGRPFLVMEYIAGGSLDRHLAGKPMPPRDAATLVSARAYRSVRPHSGDRSPRPQAGQRAALGAGARDSGRQAAAGVASSSLASSVSLQFVVPKIADFGLAKQLDSDSLDVRTPSGAVVGTPAYMAPGAGCRQGARSARPRTWRTGAVLYECLTGRPPFGRNAAGDVAAGANVRANPPRRLNPQVPAALENVCLKCLRKDPAKRYLTAGELADDLTRFLEGSASRPGPNRRPNALALGQTPPCCHFLTVTAAVVAVLAVVGILLYWNTYVRVGTAHFANLVRRQGVPVGVGELTADQVSRRQRSYRVTTRGGRVIAVEVVNGHGRLTSDHPFGPRILNPVEVRRECRYEYQPAAEGRAEETAYDRAGEVVWTFHPTTATHGFYTDAGRAFPRPRSGSGAAHVQLTWTPGGLEQEVRYLDGDGEPQPAGDGSFGQRHTFDERGLPVETVNLGPDSNPLPHRDGYTSLRTVYDSQGNAVEVRYFDRAGNPAVVRDGYSAVMRQYDAEGNLTEEAFFGLDGRPALHRDGYARVNFTYDRRGNPTGQAFFGPDGRPALHRNGYARVVITPDARGNLVQWEYRDADDRPALHRDGNATLKVAYNDRDERTEEEYLGPDGRPAPKDGYARITWKYNRGRVVEEHYYDAEGKPTLFKDGFAHYEADYDVRGNLKAWAYLDTEGKPAVHRNGFHRATRAFDQRGNVTEEAYWGTDGTPAVHAEGFARKTTEYDRRGDLVAQSYFGPDGRPTLHRDGYATFKAKYERGQRVEESYLDADGRLTLHREGHARTTWVLDDRGRAVSEAYWEPTVSPRSGPMGTPHCGWSTTTAARNWRRRTWTRTASRRRTATARPASCRRSTPRATR